MGKAAPVLIVDDYYVLRRIMRQYLLDLGFENVTEAPDAVAALERMRETSFELVTAGWNMEPMSGLHFLNAIRAMPDGERIPFVMTMENPARPEWLAAMAGIRGATHLVKPYTPVALGQALEKAVVECCPHVVISIEPQLHH